MKPGFGKNSGADRNTKGADLACDRGAGLAAMEHAKHADVAEQKKQQLEMRVGKGSDGCLSDGVLLKVAVRGVGSEFAAKLGPYAAEQQAAEKASRQSFCRTSNVLSLAFRWLEESSNIRRQADSKVHPPVSGF